MITNNFSRISTTLKTATTVGLNSGIHKLKKSANITKKTDNDIKKQNAKIVFEALTKLRGTALKFAQLLSLESTLLSKEYMKELQKACYGVTPLNKAIVRKMIKNELKDIPQNIFKSFEENAFSAASIGQVHLATNNQDEKLAVKIQYPGIDETLKGDIALIKIMLASYMKSGVLEDTLDEIEQRLNEECDYINEAKNLIWFKEKFNNKSVIIPKVYQEYSSKKILTMEFIAGVHIPQWLKTKPTQERKNQLAQNIFDLYAYSFFELNSFQADSNLGNYLITADDKIAFLDFGCIKKVKNSFPNIIKDIVKASENQDKSGIILCLSKLGLLKKDDEVIINKYYQTLFQPLSLWIALPYLNDTFTFSMKNNYASQILPMNYEFLKQKEFQGLDKDLVFFLRGLHGLYKIFEMLEATIKLKKEL